jgi:hypothetical protein
VKFQPEAIAKLDADFCASHAIVPMAFKEIRGKAHLIVAAADPSDHATIDQVKFIANCPVAVAIASETEVIRAIRPQIYVKGGDYTLEGLDPGERGALEEVGASIEILELVPGRSTTSILEKINKA